MSKTDNFDAFLHVLDHIEGQHDSTSHCECHQSLSSDSPLAKTLPVHSECHSVDSSVEWVSETSKGKVKPRRYSLQRPGFIYRRKDFSRSSYLDNNLWEYTRGRRVLKSPSFKYKAKLKPATTHSAMILEDMCNLYLHTQPPSGIRSIHKPNTHNCDKSPDSNNNNSTHNFLPLRSNIAMNAYTSLKPLSKRKSLIKPSRFGRKTFKERPSAAGACSETQAVPFTMSIHQAETFQQLSSNAEKFDNVDSLLSPGQYRDSIHSLCHKQDSRNEFKEPRSLPETDRSCSLQARIYENDPSTDELSSYVEDMLFLPQKMSSMAEMMYT